MTGGGNFHGHRKTRDQALILLIVGLLLLMPPIAAIFHLEVKLGGIPITVIYLFTVWAGLIVGAAWLSRKLADDREDPQDGTVPGDDNE